MDTSPEMQRYHDEEWGAVVHDDTRLFEKISLEGFQAGLSWATILRKRPRFREVFHGFDIPRVARMDEGDVLTLLDDAGIIRHRGKIEAVINNASRALEVQKEFGSLDSYVWQFEVDVSKRPKRLTREYLCEHTTSPESVALSKDLRKRGFKFAALAFEVGVLSIGLRTHRNVFARRHRHRACNNSGHTGDEHCRFIDGGSGHTDHQTCGGNQTIIGAKNGCT